MSNFPTAKTADTFPAIAPATLAAQRWALALSIALFAAFCALVPFARIPTPRLGVLIPIRATAFILICLMAAGFLFFGFRRSHLRAALVLANGYLFTALLSLSRLLVLPVPSSTAGDFLAAGPQTSVWLDIFRQGGFPLFAIGYALAKRREGRKPRSVAGAGAAVAGVSAVVGATAGIWLLATIGHEILPRLIVADHHTTAMLAAGIVVVLIGLAALVVLGTRRPYSVLDLWLLVILCAWLLGATLGNLVSATRFDLGSEAGGLFGLFAATVMPVVLLIEASRIAGLLDAAIALAAERNAALVRSREELARAQQLEAIGQLTGGLAHDFNNLLTVVIANLELIGEAGGNAEKIERLVQNALKAAERGTHLVRQLLTYARRQTGHARTVDLNRLIADSESLIARLIGEAIEVVSLPSSAPALVRIDPAQFETALLNLVINSRDAMAEGGRLTIETRHVIVEPAAAEPEAPAGPYVMVTVRDTGAGMTPEILARAFDPFFTTKGPGIGSGLGLSQVYGVAKTAGGHVTITSAPGAGSAVALYLPPSPERPVESRPAIESPSPPPVCGDETILLVEDDEEVLAVTAECLEELGYRVVTAADAAQAMAILSGEGRVDLLFSDVIMPGGTNGAQLAVAARRLRPGLKVLLTSGYSAAALNLEPDLPDDLTVVDKPFRRDGLARKLKATIAR